MRHLTAEVPRKKNTTILRNGEDRPDPIAPDSEGLDLGVLRPWRIALLIRHLQVRLIIDLIDTLSIGRCHEDSNSSPDIDLRPFDAEKLGVSRLHLFIKLEGARVVVVDNKSSNGTKVNGHLLQPDKSYPIRNGDELALGALKIQIALLVNPLD